MGAATAVAGMTRRTGTGDVRHRGPVKPDPTAETAARAAAARLRAPWRQAFAAQWLAYRWEGASEPYVPEGMRPDDFVRFIDRLGGWRPDHFDSRWLAERLRKLPP